MRPARALPLALFGAAVLAGCAPHETLESLSEEFTPETSGPPLAEPEPQAQREPKAPEAPEPSALRWTTAECDLAPLSLTSSDGVGLALTKLDARVVVHGPLAFTELHLAFHNPRPRQIEGRFEVTLPEDAAISRLAMAIDGEWQEGEVVERQAAQRIYEDILHRKDDPALMEKQLGNVYGARVFPIPANADKQLIVSYSQELAGGEAYRLPLCGLPELGQLDVDIRAQPFPGLPGSEELERFAVHQRAVRPRGDVELTRPAWGGLESGHGVWAGDMVVSSVVPLPHTQSRTEGPGDAPLERVTILFDTSASRANDFDGQLARLGQLIAALDQADPERSLELELIAFDQSVETLYTGTAADFDEAVLRALLRRGPLGATRLDVALDALAFPANRAPEGDPPTRVIAITDGMLTAGEELAGLQAALGRLRDHGTRRLDVIVDGNALDTALLEALVRTELPDPGLVIRPGESLDALATRLRSSVHSGLPVTVEGASWVWPATVDGVQPGDAVLVYARMDSGFEGDGGGPRALEMHIGGEAIPVALEAAPTPLVDRALARATIDAYQRQLAAMSDEAFASEQGKLLREHVVDTSVRARVLSDYTALLVLETEDDYDDYGIPRDDLAEILTVGSKGVEVLSRDETEIVVAARNAFEDDAKYAYGRGSGMGFGASEEEDEDVWGGLAGEEVFEASPYGSARAVAADRIHLDQSSSPLGGVGGGAGFGGSVSVASAGASAEAPRRRAVSGVEAIDRRRYLAERMLLEVDVPRHVLDEADHSKPYTGRYAEFMALLTREEFDAALALATAWVEEAPGEVLAMVALGQAYAALDRSEDAARAFGSLIDLHPGRADIRRMAGARLEALGEPGWALALDTYSRALDQRPDHPTAYRLVAWTQVKLGDLEAAFDTLEAGLSSPYPEGRFYGYETILRQDLGIVAATWIARAPEREAEIRERTQARYTRVNTRESLRVVLNWETDTNDVDLHVMDNRGQVAFHGSLAIPSGALVADVTTGYGPEAFVSYGRWSAFPYRIGLHYYSRGPMGYGMGKLQVIEHDGEGNLEFIERPFVIMADNAALNFPDLRMRPSTARERGIDAMK